MGWAFFEARRGKTVHALSFECNKCAAQSIVVFQPPTRVNKKSLQMAAWLAAMAVALAIAARFWSLAFPVAAATFPLTRGEVRGRMEWFLAAMGAPVAGYRSALRFE